ncbi:hypothetical protein E2C01_097222 [Portunus trituberculatus]|uniref:Uncharacterized protein n=1 Tax=Portunus trituberculatus TaxID=210409 RepID=A0A5B7JZW5_PORTR|nr:hypothetical protein [Portunus trituberculatus]
MNYLLNKGLPEAAGRAAPHVEPPCTAMRLQASVSRLLTKGRWTASCSYFQSDRRVTARRHRSSKANRTSPQPTTGKGRQTDLLPYTLMGIGQEGGPVFNARICKEMFRRFTLD